MQEGVPPVMRVAVFRGGCGFDRDPDTMHDGFPIRPDASAAVVVGMLRDYRHGTLKRLTVGSALKWRCVIWDDQIGFHRKVDANDTFGAAVSHRLKGRLQLVHREEGTVVLIAYYREGSSQGCA